MTYRAVTGDTIRTISLLNSLGAPNMLFAGASVGTESAQLGYLLSALVAERTGGERFYSFFANSTEEAIAGVIKLARHRAVRQGKLTGGWVLAVDSGGRMPAAYDPARAGAEAALIPHVVWVSSVREAFVRRLEQPWCAIVVPQGSGPEVKDLLAEAKRIGALSVVSDVDLTADLPVADTYVFGEGLVDYQVPFGCFTMSAQAYSVWNNSIDSLAHTSTFGGNGVCLTIALEKLKRDGLVDAAADESLSAIAGDRAVRNEHFRHHVNPQAANGMAMFDLDLDIQSARGMRLVLADGRKILDCAGGTGASMRGHNPPDLTEKVLATHSAEHDYFADLADVLTKLTGFPHAFPAVSGTTSVENALRLALLADPSRRKIVTFTGNYSGKTLASLNLSRHGPQRSASDPDAFRPYYRDVIYVDPFAPDAASRFASVVSHGDVGLVWFELIQGMSCRPLPVELVRRIAALRGEHGYLVGVDEVLTGVWRSGSSFLAHQSLLDEVDFTTLAKPLSDMTLPIAVTLASDKVVRLVKQRHPDDLAYLRDRYRHNLAAHIAWHVLSVVSALDNREAQQVLGEGVARVVRRSSLFEAAAGTGSHLRLVPSRRWFPGDPRSVRGQLIEASIQDLIMRRCRVLLAQQRFFPPLFADVGEVREAMSRLDNGLRGVTPATVYLNAIRRICAATLVRLRKRRARKQGVQ
jgi:acetylornithine/succinyldiaminopimelate/putrescine aminotransferase